MKHCKICKQSHDKDGKPLKFYFGAKACIPCVKAYQKERHKQEKEMVANHPLKHLSQQEIARRWNEKHRSKVTEVKEKHGEKVK